ncbi:citrate/2-methylcitrate synthase [Leptospira sp. GIMC2001]|uniref:citrate/2-methylcitrate synthase n=1 Tax=Leptospira sp. GIMC2001 TaxID=1513297 RepID=UPI00234906F9|nr:citrate/2-methylcitrate synthase [Leptospira sp. GIMC2001]WCL48580.1 citrate synthase [Leptospira sp. GIMC2001]
MNYKQAQLNVDGKLYEIPLITGTDGRQGLDISELYKKTGLISVDPGLFNTAMGHSKVSRRVPETGELFYRGYDIEELTMNSTFVETAYLLIYGDLPNKQELADFSRRLSKHSMIHEDMLNLFDGFPGKANPLAALSVMVTSLSSYYPDNYEENLDKGVDQVTRLLAKVRTIAAFTHRHSQGHPFVYPLDKLPYCTNFLHMLHTIQAEGEYNVPPEFDSVLNKLWILYGDHEQNVSATTVQIIGSTKANLFASIAAGIAAQWGSREGGRPVAAVELLEDILRVGMDAKSYFERFKTGEVPLHSNGFGQKAYDAISPRARVARKVFQEFYKNRKLDPIESLAVEIDSFIWDEDYFVKNNLYPNLEFYSGILFHTLGIPKELFTSMQVIGRLPGWMAHWRELRKIGETSKVRPRQIFVGDISRKYIPITSRI